MFSVTQKIVSGFIVIIFIGALLLSMPFSSNNNSFQSFIDALFTSTSAVTTTGLIVVDTGGYYNTLGQLIIIGLIQIGGLGYMIFIGLVVSKFRGGITINLMKFYRESISKPESISILSYSKFIIIYTIIVEALGTLLLGFYWQYFMPIGSAFYNAFFHSISAFCTAGFSLYNDSLMQYKESYFVNIIISVLCILGAVGFLPILEIFINIKNKINKKRMRKLSVHSSIVLLSTFLIFAFSTFLYLLFNHNEKNILTNFLTSSFQVISASTTAGFNSIEIADIHPSTLLILILIMYIGASPGGTGGGIKTTTFSVLIGFVYKLFKGNGNLTLLKKTIPQSITNKAVAAAIFSIIIIFTSVIALLTTEAVSLIVALFEVVSAMGTVGLSMGITAHLSLSGKIIIISNMFIGRIGALALGFSLVKKDNKTFFSFPEEEIYIA